MNLDLPQNLHSTRDLLMASLRPSSNEHAPALPKGLLEDLTRSVAHQSASVRQGQFAGFLSSVRAMFASPAFGGAAAAIAILAVASSVALRPADSQPTDTFRGAASYSSADSIQVILVGAPNGMMRSLESGTDFENGIFSAASSAESVQTIEGPRVIVDFVSKTITGIRSDGETFYHTELPASTSGISLEISSALTRF
jgi:hypothetical protein